MSRTVAAFVAALMAVLMAGTSHGHEGHDHGPEPVAKTDASPRGAGSSELFELVAIAKGEELVFYLDRFASNEPVTDANIEVETPDGPVAAVASEGTYRLKAAWLAKPGHYDLIATVTAGSDTDILPITIDIPDRTIGTPVDAGLLAKAKSWAQLETGMAAAAGLLLGIVIMSVRRRPRGATGFMLAILLLLVPGGTKAHEGHDHGPPAPAQAGGDRAARNADGTVFVPKAIQRIFGIRTMVAVTGSHPQTMELAGRIIPNPNTSGYVQTAVGGRLSPPPGGFPLLGTAVRKGDVLAHVTPPLQQIDISDMRQRQGELDQQIAIVERRKQRYERLAPSGAIAAIQLEETNLELEGLRERRAQLDVVRREPEALVAPVSGVIADRTAVAGQIAQPNAVVFHIIDPSSFWVEALSFSALSEPDRANATTAEGVIVPLSFRGSGWADRNQAISVHFAITNGSANLRTGQFVTVHLDGNGKRQGIAVPRESVIRASNGQQVVYVHVAPEQFEAKPVRVETLDGERVLLLAGLEPGARVAIQGAELLDHVR